MRGRPALKPGEHGIPTYRKTPNGQTEASCYLRLYNGKRVEVTARRKNKTAAAQALAENIELRLRNTGVPGTDLDAYSSVSQFVNRYFLKTVQDKAPATIEAYESVISRFIEPRLGSLKIVELTPTVADAFLKELPATTARHAKVVLAGAAKVALKHGIINRSPVEHAELPKAQKKPVAVLEAGKVDAFRQVIAACGDRQLVQLIEVALGTGLRAGELMALRVCDVDLSATPPTLHVAGHVRRVTGEGLKWFEGAKTKAGVRVIKINDRVAAVVQEQLTQLNVDGVYSTGPDAPLFPSAAGTFLDPMNVNKRFARAVKGSEFEPVRFHTIRHLVATEMANSVADIRSAASVLGHADSRVTDLVYAQRPAADASRLEL